MPNQPLLSLVDNLIVDCFPEPNGALVEPDGLLAAGGDLSQSTLLDAYRRGIFPWFSDGQPILWWCPSERCVLVPGGMKISRSLGKTLKREIYSLTYDQAFSEVVKSCAAPRAKQSDTWITPQMHQAYLNLHQSGIAHSIECWHEKELVGGLYGLSIGQVFFGESMFSRMNDASKVALAYLSRQLKAWDFRLIDCQIHNSHLASLGAVTITREDFLDQLRVLANQPPTDAAWS